MDKHTRGTDRGVRKSIVYTLTHTHTHKTQPLATHIPRYTDPPANTAMDTYTCTDTHTRGTDGGAHELIVYTLTHIENTQSPPQAQTHRRRHRHSHSHSHRHIHRLLHILRHIHRHKQPH